MQGSSLHLPCSYNYLFITSMVLWRPRSASIVAPSTAGYLRSLLLFNMKKPGIHVRHHAASQCTKGCTRLILAFKNKSGISQSASSTSDMMEVYLITQWEISWLQLECSLQVWHPKSFVFLNLKSTVSNRSMCCLLFEVWLIVLCLSYTEHVTYVDHLQSGCCNTMLPL